MEDFSHLWERQITALRDSFSADSSVGAPTSGSPSLQRGDGGRDYDTHESEHGWDDKINSVVDALDELALCVSVLLWLPSRHLFSSRQC